MEIPILHHLRYRDLKSKTGVESKAVLQPYDRMSLDLQSPGIKREFVRAPEISLSFSITSRCSLRAPCWMIGDEDIRKSGIQCSSRVSDGCTYEVEMGQFLSSMS